MVLLLVNTVPGHSLLSPSVSWLCLGMYLFFQMDPSQAIEGGGVGPLVRGALGPFLPFGDSLLQTTPCSSCR